MQKYIIILCSYEISCFINNNNIVIIRIIDMDNYIISAIYILYRCLFLFYIFIPEDEAIITIIINIVTIFRWKIIIGI